MKQRKPEIADKNRAGNQKIGAHGKQRAVGEVRDVEDAGDQRQAEPHQGIQHARRDPVEDLTEEEIQKLKTD